MAIDAFPPTSYQRLYGMMRRGEGYRAPGPCAIPGCAYRIWEKPFSPPFVWDHCHVHDYVRGILCRTHNVQMGPVDRQDHSHLRAIQRHLGQQGIAELLAYWLRCPECAALGPWQPIMVRHSSAIVRRAFLLERAPGSLSGGWAARRRIMTIMTTAALERAPFGTARR